MSEKSGNNLWNSGENRHIGNQGEFYCRSLYGLMKHPNGDMRPDLISVNGSYKPKFTMEVKTSKEGNGVINPHGLTYGFTTASDYKSIFGIEAVDDDPETLITNIEFNRFSGVEGAAFYYNIVNRTDKHANIDFKMPFDDLGIEFGDQMLLPHELIFYSYVIGKMPNYGKNFDKAFEGVRKTVNLFIKGEYQYGKLDKHDLQSIHFQDFLAIFMEDESLLRSPEARERVRLLKEFYGDDRLSDLGKVEYVGPNNTRIYAFHKQEHKGLFHDQIRSRIASRRDILTRLSQSRKKELSQLPKEYRLEEETLDIGIKLGESLPVISKTKRILLERLLEWKRVEDDGPEFSDLHPVQVEKTDTSQKTDPF